MNRLESNNIVMKQLRTYISPSFKSIEVRLEGRCCEEQQVLSNAAAEIVPQDPDKPTPEVPIFEGAFYRKGIWDE